MTTTMVQLACKIGESASDGACYGMVTHPMTPALQCGASLPRTRCSAEMKLASGIDESATDVAFDAGEQA